MTRKKPTDNNRTSADTPERGIAHPLPSALTEEGFGVGMEAEGHTPTLEELSKRLKGLEGGASDEDIGRAIQENWQKVAGAILIGLLVIWVVDGLRSVSEKKAWEASDRLMSAQQAFSTVVKAASSSAEGGANTGTNNTEEEKKSQHGLNQTLAALEKSDSVYGKLARLYSAAVAVAKGEGSSTLGSHLSSFKTTRYNSDAEIAPRQPISESDLTDEFAALLQARALLDGSPEQAVEGKRLLLHLVYGGQFLNGEALVAYTRAAASDDERAKATAALGALKSARAEIYEHISAELQSHGVTITQQ